jgi:hypothetical protein
MPHRDDVGGREFGQVDLPGSTWTSLKDAAQKDKNLFGCESLAIR